MATPPTTSPEPTRPGPTALILVRHGRTTLNAEGRLRGHLDPPLDEVGAADVRRLAGRLAPLLSDGRPHRILASPLQRTIRTAEAIADRVGLTATPDDRLLDRDYGTWAGERLEEVVARWGSVDAAPGVEPLASVTARVQSLLTEPIPDEPLVLVTHDAVLHALLALLDPRLGEVPLDPASWCLIGRRADVALSVTSTNNQ